MHLSLPNLRPIQSGDLDPKQAAHQFVDQLLDKYKAKLIKERPALICKLVKQPLSNKKADLQEPCETKVIALQC